MWQEIQAIEVAPSCTGVVRRRLEQATLERIVQGLWGYVTSLAVLCDRPELEDALLEVRRRLELYIALSNVLSEQRWRESEHTDCE